MSGTIEVPSHDPRFHTPPAGRDEVDVRALEHDLAEAIEGEVRFSAGDRALYSATGANYRQLPIGVVIPRSNDDVVHAVRLCREYDAPLLSRGGGTGLAGQTTNVAVVIDFSKYLNRVLELDADRRLARVEPGLILDHLRDQAETEHQLTFGPDPSTHEYCTLGGMIASNSCGVRSIMAQFYGPGPRTSDNVHELEVLLYDGRRLRAREGTSGDAEIDRRLIELRDRYADLIRARYPKIPRRVSGYNLDDLLPENGFNVARALAGSESTCVTYLEATVHLVYSPPARALLVLGYEDAFTAGDHVPQILEHKPLGLEGIDETLVEDMTQLGLHVHDLSALPEGHGWLLIELGGETREEADERARAVMDELKVGRDGLRGMKLYDRPEQEEHVWKVREAGLGATAFLPGKEDTYEGWEDSAVPPDRIGDYLRDLQKLSAKHGYESALYGHYGNGCVHARWNFDLSSKPGLAKYRAFVEEAADLVVSYGGSISGEHGDGQSRGELLPKMFGHELIEAFREFKSIFDPGWKMNPGKVVDPYPLDSNIRLGAETFNPPPVKSHFAFLEDRGSFAHATTRCVGVGKCRRTEGGVMCPSFMVTREEKHTTRGRAHILWEMLNGEELELWRSEEVDEALDLCLSCKGCTNDCPVGVDLPTLKAEYLSHRYQGRLRPRPAYTFGLIDQAARAASKLPGLANLATRTPLFKLAAGIHPARRVPEFARVTLKEWFGRRPLRNGGGKRVLLWADTFTNYLEPEVGIAAVEALEEAGFHVVVPQGHLCCGRPLYDYGMLDLAEAYLRKVLSTLREEIRAGTPVVGVEPSCVAVFKDELLKLWPMHQDAKRLAKQTFHFAQFLTEQAETWEPPRLHRKALLHGHCHQRATGGTGPDRKLLERMGLEVEELDSGCCGMAGGWGYEQSHYDVSIACGERVLLPKVREASREAVIVGDGFSCRSQIEQAGTGRRALHLAQVLALAREHGPAGPTEPYPERAAAPPPSAGARRRAVRAAAAAAGAAAVAGAALAARK
ncbi:MAG TPA: FAD-binding and (Fe-S)-binding domain-containing protein [Gaiellaceae bacterium]|nr:FAD-binding and (Fe-S)-binding domain-containing protein [Gaiellaceae bacterium]